MSEFKLLIGGSLVDGQNKRMPVVNPATEETLAYAPRASLAQLEEAVAAANHAFPAWASAEWKHRRSLLLKFADAIAEEADELARLLTKEQGKPLPEAQGELMLTENFVRYFASLDDPSKILDRGEERSVELLRQPLGVVGAIIPWNFPLLIVAFKMPAALLTGNCMIIKPAPTTPLATLKLGEIMVRIFPPGVVNIIVDDNDLGPVLTVHPDVQKISFTGSTETGRKVMAAAAGNLKRLTLELGGNDPAIILDDVDPAAIAPAIFGSAFLNSGQVCIAIKRVYAHDSIYDALCDELAKLAQQAIVDDGLAQGAQIGPMQNKAHYEKVLSLLQDAAEHGKVLAGGERLDRQGYFIAPTIVSEVEDGCRIVDEEQFAPILPIVRYTDVQDAVARANASSFGLGASVWSSDMARARDVAGRLNAGSVWINKHIDLDPSIPFAGAGQSGLGVEFAEEGLLEFTQVKVINAAL